jgi:hypothetical protein
MRAGERVRRRVVRNVKACILDGLVVVGASWRGKVGLIEGCWPLEVDGLCQVFISCLGAMLRPLDPSACR